ncbi:polysaccharide deacetylase family protein [Parasphingopyxis algicola]|uniref:polysaccharide deacetylase family protein n=1 Tax=Parasphingopyxis algicola TaxID=2026624 RepID=UPI0015A1869A|nr:polysaccharide deacetylase family protein [Parasphingopyxis algicola]QLC26368.1 polysaccharide deacetylase family protein [Parasphingopyxis algicola]
MKSTPQAYGWWPYRDRPKICWPNDARIAFWVAPNIEFYELDPPANPTRRAWPRPYPDNVGYSVRDYGNRVGHWRMMELIDRYGLRGSISLSVGLLDHHPEIIKACVERDWEFFSHGIYNTRFVYGMDEAQEREIIRDSIDSVQQATGQRIAGWLSPGLTYTEHTLDLLAEMGLQYTCDLFHDDQVTPVKTASGRLCSVPYSLEFNDSIAFQLQRLSPDRYVDMLKAGFDRLYAEGEASGTVMCIPLHAYLVAQPFRLDPFGEIFDYVTSHEDVWITTGREIAEYWMEHYWDAAIADISEKNA